MTSTSTPTLHVDVGTDHAVAIDRKAREAPELQVLADFGDLTLMASSTVPSTDAPPQGRRRRRAAEPAELGQALTKARKFSFLATKSVSQLTSNRMPDLPAASMRAATMPSLAARSAFLAALAMPFSRST